MAVTKTSLSAGEIIRAILISDEDVKQRTNKVFPVAATDTETLPYILYRRSSMVPVPTKGATSADTVQIEVLCFTESYSAGVELAEAVRSALDHRQYEGMRSCTLNDSEEAYQDDAYVQQLVFNVKI